MDFVRLNDPVNDLGVRYVCPVHGALLCRTEERDEWCCPKGCSFPVVNGIPRFVPSGNYAAAFGLQWNQFRRTQLDSYTGIPVSRDRLTRLLGGTLEQVAGKRVLEAGCGAGRFTEILLAAGAQVLASDISSAVEANQTNGHDFSNYQICQADLLHLPVTPAQFDIVVCVGVVQHTPNPEETMEALCRHVKPGGMLVMDHYTYGYPVTVTRQFLRECLLRHSPTSGLRFCRLLVGALWPLHRLAWGLRELPLCSRLRALWLRISPVVDYHDAYSELGPGGLRTWAILDTHDTLTDRFKHLRSADEIKQRLAQCGRPRIQAE